MAKTEERFQATGKKNLSKYKVNKYKEHHTETHCY